MKRILLIYFLPLICALTLTFLLAFKSTINSSLFTAESPSPIDPSFRNIPNFNDNVLYENEFLSSRADHETIFMLGSSELGVNTEATPYNFITDHFNTKVVGVGHAGNQSFSIFSQLLANEPRLKNAPILIGISPGWFHEVSANGTTSSQFLEFNSSRFLNSILMNDSIDTFKAYEANRISSFYGEIVSPDLSIKLLHFKSRSSKSFLHQFLYAPIIAIDDLLYSLRSDLLKTNSITTTNSFERKSIREESVVINWDSLFTVSKQDQLNRSTNNNWSIDNTYYTNNINGKRSFVSPVQIKYNTEMEDFLELLKLLKEKKVNASFFISPLNPYYFKNASDLSPIVAIVETELKKNNFPYLNLWNSDSTTFEKGILFDIGHLSKYGFYKVDKFIVETYKLTK